MTTSAYTWRDPLNCHLPSDVIRALGASAIQHRQVRIIVFAVSREAAFGVLARLSMAPLSPSDLSPASGLDIRAITARGDNQPGYVYAVHGGLIGRIVLNEHGKRGIHPYSFAVTEPADDLNTEAEPEVTDAMVDAALDALVAELDDQYLTGRLITGMRKALTAALRARQGES